MNERPLYIRIADSLRRDLVNGVYKTSDSLPSESDLMAEYVTSRVTVRKAMDILEHEGLIRAERGRGYFVEPPRHAVFTLTFSDAHSEEELRYQAVNLVLPDSDVAEALRLSENQPAIVTGRIILKNGSAVAFDEKYIPYVKGEPSIEFELNFREFPDMFAERYSSRSLHTEMHIGLERAPDRVQRAMRMEAPENLMVVRRLILSSDNKPVAYGKLFASRDFDPIFAESGCYTE